MKNKRIICLTVLALSMAGFMYAQELKINGYFNSGLGIVYTSSADSDTFLKALGVDSEQNGYRFRLNGSYTNEEENAGIRFRLQSQSQLNPGGYFSLPLLYGWVQLFNDTVYLAGGIVDDSTWQTAEWFIVDDVGEGLGALLKITPLAGLDLGFGVYLISQQSSGANNILTYGTLLPNFGDITPKIGDAKYVFSGSYTMPDLFYLGVSFRLKNKAGWKDTIEEIKWYGYTYNGRQESSRLIGEFRFLMIKNLTAIAAVSLDTLEEFSAYGDTILSQTLAYKLNNLIIGLNATEFLYNREDALGKKITYNPGLLFNLWGSYTVNNIMPRLDLVYFYGGQSKVGGDETYMWHRRGFVNTDIDIYTANDRIRSVLSARPSVMFDVSNSFFIEVGDIFNYDFGNYDSAYGDSSDPSKRYRMSNVFYLDFTWRF
jgi:hypothetical protein